jgi:Ca-activated chloride channel family protein
MSRCRVARPETPDASSANYSTGSPMSDPIWNDPRITAYALGELAGAEKSRFEEELQADPVMAEAVEEARRLTDQLRSLFAGEHHDELDPQRREAVLAQASQAEVSPADSMRMASGGRSSFWHRYSAPLALAASVGVIAVGFAMTRRLTPLGRQTMLRTNDAAPAPASRAAAPMGAPVMLDQAEGLSRDGVIDSLGDAPAGQLNANGSDDVLDFYNPAIVTDAPAEVGSGKAAASVPSQVGKGIAVKKELMEAKASAGEYALAVTPNAVLSKRGRGDLSGSRLPAMPFGMAAPGAAPGPGKPQAEGELAEQTDGFRSLGVDVDSKRFSEEARVKQLAQSKDLRAKFAKMDGEAPFGEAVDEGRGPGLPGDKFEPITDNPFLRVGEQPLSTFSVDVDTASYSKVRDYLVRAHELPRPDAVRIEEMINYFDYGYAPPEAGAEHPFAARVEIVTCPWNVDHRLARIALQGKRLQAEQRPPCNLVFLIDTSGSMDAPNKLPLVQEGMQLLLSKLDRDDRVAIVTYAGSAGLVLDATPGDESAKIRRALTELAAGGSTNGGAGITLAYQTARDHFIAGGANRVILCTDGDFNVGTTGTDELVRIVEREAKGGVFLTVLGFGMGNHNDAMLEQVSGRGNGNYAFIDTDKEARKVLVQQADATLVTIAKDVKLQIEFNPNRVAAYRLIGYENRVLAKEDFNDDKKDAGEIGAGHSVTALYEIVPAGKEVDAIAPPVDELKYQSVGNPNDAAASDETMTLKLRYKAPDGDTSRLVEFPVTDTGKGFDDADIHVRFAAAVAGFGMKLRSSPYAGKWTLADVRKTAAAAIGDDPHGLRAEFVELVQAAATLRNENE